MTKHEMAKAMAILQEIYPITSQNPDHLVTIWHTLFEGVSYEEMIDGIQLFMKEDTTGNYNRFPAPGQILNCLKKQHLNAIESPEEAWMLVLRAARNGIHESGKAFAALPSHVKKAVDHPGFIRELAFANDFGRESLKKTFMKHYATARETEALNLAQNAPALPDNDVAGQN